MQRKPQNYSYFNQFQRPKFLLSSDKGIYINFVHALWNRNDEIHRANGEMEATRYLVPTCPSQSVLNFGSKLSLSFDFSTLKME
jgi:hypothetical protein